MLSMKLRLGSEFSSSNPMYNPNVARVGPGDRVTIDVMVIGTVLWPNAPGTQTKLGSFEAGIWVPVNQLEVKAVYPHTQTNSWKFEPFAYDAASGVLMVKASGSTNLLGMQGAALCSIEANVKAGTEGMGGVISLFNAKIAGKDIPAMGAEFNVEFAQYKAKFEDVTVKVGETGKVRLILSDVSGNNAPLPALSYPSMNMHTKWDLNTEVAKVVGARRVMQVNPDYLPPLRETAYPNDLVIAFKWNKTPGVWSPLPPMTLPYGPLIELDVFGVKKGKTPLNMLNAGISAVPEKLPALYGDGMITVV